MGWETSSPRVLLVNICRIKYSSGEGTDGRRIGIVVFSECMTVTSTWQLAYIDMYISE